MKTECGPGHFEVMDIPRPAVRNDDDVLIRVLAAGVCGTDVHIYHDTFRSYPPVVLGHEFSGVVEECGAAVSRVAPGDRVVCEPHTKFCGECDMCRSGRIQLCPHKRSPGWGIDGAFSDFLVVPELFLHRVPDNVADDVAALAEPLAIVTHALTERCRILPGDCVAISGAGSIGLLAVAAAKAAGAARVILLGTHEDEELRFRIAGDFGADLTLNVRDGSFLPDVLELTGGRGADVVADASGSELGIGAGIDIIKKCGRFCAIGLPKTEAISVAWGNMVKKSLDVSFCMSSSVSSWDRALSVMERTELDLSRIITHRERIENWRHVFSEIAAGRVVKAMFIPHIRDLSL